MSEIEELWRDWVAERNLRALRIMSLLLFVLHPIFWLLDWVVVGGPYIWFFGALRLVGLLFGALVLILIRGSWGRQHHLFLGVTSTALVIVALLAMTWALGGPTSSYYAGLNLAMLGTGLLFLFGNRVAIAVYGGTALAWIVMVAFATGPGELGEALGNTLFVLSTAGVVIVAQFFLFHSFHSQVRANRALELTKGSLETANTKLKELDRFKSEVFANITHELKTPLALVLSPLELMLSGDLGTFTEAQNASLASMFQNGIKLLKMIGDILTLTSLEESRIRLKVSDLDVAKYLRELAEQVEPLMARKNIDLTFESDVEKASVWCDIERLEQVFINLLSNAAKFTPEGGEITLSLRDSEDSVEIAVADNGPGFSMEDASRIFERFVQLDGTSTRRFGGAGIGLALSRELVELHGGKIWAESEIDQGATFKVQLIKDLDHFRPDALDRRSASRNVRAARRATDRSIGEWAFELTTQDNYRLQQIAEATERRVVHRDPDEDRRAHTVLVVEDMPDVIRIVHLTLRQHFKVLAAEDGLKGLELARSHAPNLIITDLMMPGIDGLELVTRLRSDSLTSHIPIIMLTARAELEDRVAGLESGVNAYLSKPFSPRELITTVRSLLDIQEQTADMILMQRMDSLETVAGGLAHEINNPLNYIRNALGFIGSDLKKVAALVEAANERELNDKETKALVKFEERVGHMSDTAEAGLKRIAATVETLRSYSREGYTRILRPHDVYKAVHEVIALIRPAIGRKVAVETKLEGDGIIQCVPEELNQVLTNLIQNAIEASPERTGLVEVIGEVEESELVLTFRDNGVGMAPHVADRVFTPFFTTKGPGKGSGIGLTITWRVIKSLNGTVKVKSSPGAGTEFVVRLPLEQPDVMATNGWKSIP